MKKLVILLMLLLIVPLETKALYVNGEKIDFEHRITTPANKNFAYMIHEGCEYTVAIPDGAKKTDVSYQYDQSYSTLANYGLSTI